MPGDNPHLSQGLCSAGRPDGTVLSCVGGLSGISGNTQNNTKQNQGWEKGEMAGLPRPLRCKPDDLSSVPRTHVTGAGDERRHRVVLSSPHVHPGTLPTPNTGHYIHTKK